MKIGFKLAEIGKTHFFPHLSNHGPGRGVRVRRREFLLMQTCIIIHLVTMTMLAWGRNFVEILENFLEFLESL